MKDRGANVGSGFPSIKILRIKILFGGHFPSWYFDIRINFRVSRPVMEQKLVVKSGQPSYEIQGN